MSITLTFDRPSRRFILDAFGKSIDHENFVVERDNTSQRVLTKNGSEIKATQFAGIRKGSEIYIKANDIDSIIDAADHID